jgi:hypothetical protein
VASSKDEVTMRDSMQQVQYKRTQGNSSQRRSPRPFSSPTLCKINRPELYMLKENA